MPIWKRFALMAGAGLLLSLLFISLILPGIIVERASRWAVEETGRRLTIDALQINPFSLSIEVSGLNLSDKDTMRPFVSWEFLRISLSASSLIHRAPVIDELKLARPSIHLERITEETFNFSDLIPAGDEPTPVSDSEQSPKYFSINNIVISDGSIELIDSSLDEPASHTISDLQLVLPSLGNLPAMIETAAAPYFSAKVNDAPTIIEGQLKPFSDTQEMQVALELTDIDLPFYLGYVPVELPVEVLSGKLNLDLDVLYRTSPKIGGEVVIGGKVDLTSLNIHDRLGEQLFFLPLMQIEIAPSRPLVQDIHLSALRLYNLEVQLNRDTQGKWNHARMAEAKPKPATSVERPKENSPPSELTLKIDAVEIRDGVLFFRDELPAKDFETTAREINIDVDNFALDAESIPLQLSLETEYAETLVVDATFRLDPFNLNLHGKLDNLYAALYEPYYDDVYTVPLGGRLDARINIAVSPEKPFLLRNSLIRWRDGYMAFNENEGIGIELFVMDGIDYDLSTNRLEIDDYKGDNGKINFSRDKEGRWSFLSANFPILRALTEVPDEESPAPEKKSEGPEFSYHIGRLSVTNCQFDIIDNQPATPVELQADHFNLTFRNLASPQVVRSPFTFTTVFGQQGLVKAKGFVSLAEQSVDLTGQVSNIALPTFAPYLAETTNLVLVGGVLDAEFGFSLIDHDPIDLRFTGRAGIDRMHLLDATHREDLITWDSLQVTGIQLGHAPTNLNIASVTLSDYFTKILIDEEGRLNLVEAFKNEETDSQKAEATSTTEDEPNEPSSSHTGIGKVILQGGNIDFTDRSLPNPFHADMRELGGRIDGLNSKADTRAEVELIGSLRGRSPLTITGDVNPLAEELFADIELSFLDIEMSPFSPYSGNFAGYLIERGKLNLTLDYTVEKNRLKAGNKVFLDQLTFGEKVESENATKLPVKLAVALLKDSNGEIHLEIPVSGSLEDPEFSVASVVWTVLKNLLVKAATSPFSLLGALFGDDGGDFGSITFAPGSAQLTDSEKEKLLRITQALKERPGLDIAIRGFIDPKSDPEGYRREQLTTKIRRAKYLELIEDNKLPQGEVEDDITVAADEYEDYLWEVYREEKFPKPRNFIGRTKKLPVTEMEKLIYTNTEAGPEQMTELARARSEVAYRALLESGQIASERVFLTEPENLDEASDGDKAGSRVELSLTAH